MINSKELAVTKLHWPESTVKYQEWKQRKENKWPESSGNYQEWKLERGKIRRTVNIHTFWLILHPGLEKILSFLDRDSLVNLTDAAYDITNERLVSILNNKYDTDITNPFNPRSSFRRISKNTYCSSPPILPNPLYNTRRTYCMCDKCTFGTFHLEKGKHYNVDEFDVLEFNTEYRPSCEKNLPEETVRTPS